MSTIRIIGRFFAFIPVPIIASFDILDVVGSSQFKSRIDLKIGQSDVSVLLGDYTDPTSDELPTIKSFEVQITRSASLQCKTGIRKALPRSEENYFEDVLIEAVGRVVTAIKRKTKQAFINTRHPVHSYEFSYFREDCEVNKPFYFNDPAIRKLPRYALGRVAFDSLSAELDTTLWTNLGPEINSPVRLPTYDELIFDALTFRDGLNYQMATLSAAIAIELMVSKIYTTFLHKECGITKPQVKPKRRLKIVCKVKLVNRL